jgi:hypothetical protein
MNIVWDITSDREVQTSVMQQRKLRIGFLVYFKPPQQLNTLPIYSRISKCILVLNLRGPGTEGFCDTGSRRNV